MTDADINLSNGGPSASNGPRPQQQTPPPAPPLTLLLERVNRGERAAFDEMVRRVYDELRRRAAAYLSRQAPGQTLQPTALVHEAFAKLVGSGPTGAAHGNGGELPAGQWKSTRHFFHAAAEAMRQILVDHARAKAAAKRGGGGQRVDLADVQVAAPAPSGGDDPVDWETLDAALRELQRADERRYQVVMLRYFAGLSDRQIADSLEVSEKTVQRDWSTARIFLRARMAGPP